MRDESILPIATTKEPGANVRLAFVPKKIPTLTSCNLEQTYQAKRDFLWKPGSRNIHIPPASRIPILTQEQLYRPAHSQQHGRCRDRENDIFFAPDDEYHQLQTAVTYPFNFDSWQTPVNLKPTGTLPRTAELLSQPDEIKIVLLGDSISVGHNASGLCKVPPYQQAYGPLVCHALNKKFAATSKLINLSVGGKTSTWGLEQIDTLVKHQPDLVILAFGMNDASGHCEPLTFQANIQATISKIRASLPDAEFILVASMTANAQWIHAEPALYPQYRDVQTELQTQGIVLADIYSLWAEMVHRKSFLDLTGNGLNHPNDFGHQLYAQALWATLMHATGQQTI